MELLLFAALVPVVCLCSFIYKKDNHKESGKLLWKLFLQGLLCAFPVIFVETLLDKFFPHSGNVPLFSLFINVFIGVALVEEGFKWFVTKTVGYNNVEFDEIFDIIVYSVFASLGFACIENVLYVFSYGLVTAIIRAITSVPGHMCFAVIMGYYLAKAKIDSINDNQNGCRTNIFLSIFIPTLIHIVYDYILMGSLGFMMFLVFVITLFCFSFSIVDRMSKMQVDITKKRTKDKTTGEDFNTQSDSSSVSSTGDKTNFCPSCGSRASDGTYCFNCGYKLK